MNYFFFFLFIFIFQPIFSQLPNSDIWLSDIIISGKTISINKPINITNRTGYDNQPSFSPDDEYIYYSSIRDVQADIYRYNAKTKSIEAFTHTPESEYSPKVTPDGKFISTVVVEKDSTQRLWKYALEKPHPSSIVIQEVKEVGYYCWYNQTAVMAYTLGTPNTLKRIDTKYPSLSTTIANNIGRSMAVSKKDNSFYFVSTFDSILYIKSFKEFDKEDGHPLTSTVLSTVKGSEDFALLYINKEEHFIMAKSSVIYMTVSESSGSIAWKRIADLKEYGIANISRLAVSNDGKKLALVNIQ